MRTLVEIIVVALLIGAGWSKPFNERLGMSRAAAQPAAKSHKVPNQAVITSMKSDEATAAASAPAASAPPTDNSWMWDPNRPGSLDRKTSPQPRRR